MMAGMATSSLRLTSAPQRVDISRAARSTSQKEGGGEVRYLYMR